MKIGITIDVSRQSLFTSGINQNGVYLGTVLAEGGHDVYLTYSDASAPGNSLKDIQDLNLENVKLCTFKECLDIKMDVIISLGVTISSVMKAAFVDGNENIKFIAYKCGNEFMVDSESYLYDTHHKRSELLHRVDAITPDAIWSIPQMENTNLHYYSFLLQTDNVTVVPFIWEPLTIETSLKNSSIELYDGRKINRIAIMEPNLSMMKFCIPPSIIADRVYKNQKDVEIEKLMLIGADGIKDNRRFKTLIKNLQLFRDGKMSADGRHTTPYILDKWAQVVLSWQWENPLNYLYFDVAWMGYPIVHNAHLCKDIGYYYEGFDYEDGEKVLAKAMRSHSTNSNYLKEQRNLIKRYTSKNKKLVEQYNQLLNDVVNGEFKRQRYHWKTNEVSSL
jgi:hypothetical protein